MKRIQKQQLCPLLIATASLLAQTISTAMRVTYVAWTWDAGSSTVTNTQGSITSQVRANASAGFSIVSYDGQNTPGTVGHGLNTPPRMIVIKARTGALMDDWAVYHESLGNQALLRLNRDLQAATGQTLWSSTSPTSSVFYLRGEIRRLLLRPSSRVLFFRQLHRQWQRRWSVCLYRV
jgi:hypothetical protein